MGLRLLLYNLLAWHMDIWIAFGSSQETIGSLIDMRIPNK